MFEDFIFKIKSIPFSKYAWIKDKWTKRKSQRNIETEKKKRNREERKTEKQKKKK